MKVVEKTGQDYVGKKNVVIAVEMLDYAGLLDYGPLGVPPVGFGDLKSGLLDCPRWASLAISDYANLDLLEEHLIVEDCKEKQIETGKYFRNQLNIIC